MQNAQKQRGGRSGKLIAVRLLQHSGTGPPDRVQLIVQHTHTSHVGGCTPPTCFAQGKAFLSSVGSSIFSLVCRQPVKCITTTLSSCHQLKDSILRGRGREARSKLGGRFFAYQTRCRLDGRNVATSSRQRYHTPRHLAAAAGSCQFSTPRQRLI